MKRINWFRLNRNLHRDIGFLCVGLTLLFCISGIAVNHVDDWNPNYKVVVEKKKLLGINKYKDLDSLNTQIKERLVIKNKLKGNYWASPNEYKLFYKNNYNVSVNFKDEVATIEKVSERFLLRRLNGLHLNNVKQIWTYVSDLFAICLMFLAISGIFMVKGKKGIKGRGGILTAIGFGIPLFFMIFYA